MRCRELQERVPKIRAVQMTVGLRLFILVNILRLFIFVNIQIKYLL
jgi:hypothetical protein